MATVSSLPSESVTWWCHPAATSGGSPDHSVEPQVARSPRRVCPASILGTVRSLLQERRVGFACRCHGAPLFALPPQRCSGERSFFPLGFCWRSQHSSC